VVGSPPAAPVISWRGLRANKCGGFARQTVGRREKDRREWVHSGPSSWQVGADGDTCTHHRWGGGGSIQAYLRTRSTYTVADFAPVALVAFNSTCWLVELPRCGQTRQSELRAWRGRIRQDDARNHCARSVSHSGFRAINRRLAGSSNRYLMAVAAQAMTDAGRYAERRRGRTTVIATLKADD